MEARFEGYCGTCGESYPAGTEIRLNEDSGKWDHEGCIVDSATDAPATKFQGTTLEDMGF